MPVGLVLTETTPQGSITYAYDAVGRRASMIVTGQPAVNYTYDASSRLTSLSTQNPVLGTLNFGIGYDSLGRRTSLTYPNGVTTNYTYDDASRITGLDHKDALNAILESLGYTYDSNGNRTGMDRQNVSLPQRPAVSGIYYNAANQMLAFSDKIITYDANGNMTSVTNTCGTTNYTWDARNRLVGMNGFKPDCTALTTSFKYDAWDRRIETNVNGRRITYLYDYDDIIQEIDNGTVTVNYMRTLNVDEPLDRIESSGRVRYYHADALGSIIGLSDENGQEVTQYAYAPFGNVTISGEISDNPFQYTGRENDGTGLYYYRARYYSSEMQRWISEDPIGFKGGRINLYEYVKNNPINYIDPSGLLTCVQQGCTFGPISEVARVNGEWNFLFSTVSGPASGSFLPIYSIRCTWRRKNIVTYGYEIKCVFSCWDKCGKRYTTTKTRHKTFTAKESESDITGGSFDFTEGWGGSKELSDMICILNFRSTKK